MGYINIFVANGCKISVKDNNLILNGEKSRHYVLQDINSIMVESRECVITTYALSELAKYNIVVYFCDERHMPISVVIPYNTYCRQLEMYEVQLSATKPTCKKLWQSIIKQKIINEAICLNLLNKDGADKLYEIADNIYSGDSGNGEANAAQVYFRKLFGNDFARDKDNIINASLNYTYSIVRGMICRSLVVYGFVPFIGIHHKNILNNYNLADDIIEPFRAICDYFVINKLGDSTELDTNMKSQLYMIVNVEVSIGGQKHSLSNAIDKVIVSLKDSMKNNTDSLLLPSLIGCDIHRYE